MSRPDVVIVTGSRDWHDVACVKRALSEFKEGTLLLHGCCRGLDLIAASVGQSRGFVVLGIPYFEDENGNEARNRSMFSMAKALQDCGHRVYGLAFPLPQSRGTYKAMRIADYLNIAIREVKR